MMASRFASRLTSPHQAHSLLRARSGGVKMAQYGRQRSRRPEGPTNEQSGFKADGEANWRIKLASVNRISHR